MVSVGVLWSSMIWVLCRWMSGCDVGVEWVASVDNWCWLYICWKTAESCFDQQEFNGQHIEMSIPVEPVPRINCA